MLFDKKFVIKLKFILITCWFFKFGKCLEIEGAMDLLKNFEAIDPYIMNIFGDIKGSSSNRKKDLSEIDLTDIDTTDIMSCFGSLSYVCFQRKILVFFDSLNKIGKINMFGGYISFVRVGEPFSRPAITEDILASRRVSDPNTLSSMLSKVFEDFVDSRVIRITIPGFNAKLDARSLSENQHTCYEFQLSEAAFSTNNTEELSETETSRSTNNAGCARGDQSMVTLTSMLVMKMFMLLPTLIKVVAAKAIFGILMGMVSLILSKMAILPYLLSPKIHQFKQHNTSPGAHGSHRQNDHLLNNIQNSVSQIYANQQQQIQQGGYNNYQNQDSNNILTESAIGSNNIILDDSIGGSTGPTGPTGSNNNIYDMEWAESNNNYDRPGLSNRNDTTYFNNNNYQNYGNQNPDFKKSYFPQYSKFNQPKRVYPVAEQPPISKRNSNFSEQIYSSTEMNQMTTADTVTSPWIPSKSISGRIKRWFSQPVDL